MDVEPREDKIRAYEPRSLALAGFASPAFAIGALGLPLTVILPPLYAGLGLSLTVVGAVFYQGFELS